MSKKKPALGRGLQALLENSDTDITSNRFSGNQERVGNIAEIAISQIEVNPFQPRVEFDKTALKELAESIVEQGLIQPITVRKTSVNQYQIISGERRFRASQMAGMKDIPAYIRVADDQGMLEMALVENIQRENLDAIEVALSFKRLIDECKLTQEELSEKVAKKRSTVTNYLRLLKLPAEIQRAIKSKDISMGHARALLSIDEPEIQLLVFNRTIEDKLSVRKVEELAKIYAQGQDEEPGLKNKDTKPKTAPSLSFDEKILLNKLCLAYQSKIEVQKTKKGKGKINIPFSSQAEFERIMELLNRD